jgi:ParB family transcriptional regulator, chromosome partitioning protein
MSSSRNRGMGRGLAAILSVSDGAEEDGAELRELAIELVQPNPDQPRKHFDQEALQALADSLNERGVLQPVLVRPRPGGTYELVAGERRWRAAQLAGLERVPALVQQRDDAQSLEVALIENMAREDLNPIEAARAVAGLVEELGLTLAEIGRRVGRSRVAVSNLLRLLDLPDEALALVERGALSEGHGRALLLADDHADRRRLARAAAEGAWSVRVLEQRAREANAPTRSATRGRAAVHPDQEAAAARIADALGAALGTDVRVRPRGTGYKVELTFDDVDQALALAHRIRPRAVA